MAETAGSPRSSAPFDNRRVGVRLFDLYPRSPVILLRHPLFILGAGLVASGFSTSLAFSSERNVLRADKLEAIDSAIEEAIADGEIPGAVLWLESRGEVHHRAYGHRMVSPGREVMTEDTVFDLASLTKVMATTPAVLDLHEAGRIDLDAPVSAYIPEFLEGGVRPEAEEKYEDLEADDRERITVRRLLTHRSGLPPGIFLSERDFWGHREGVSRAARVGLLEEPGSRFRYSDVNFILLGEIVRRVSGERIDAYAENHFFGPLGMTDTGFLPPVSRQWRIAPTTELEEYGLIRGEVHDPTARRMQGVAGHAGIFSTARDVAVYLRMWLDGGVAGETRLLDRETVTQATRNQMPEAFDVERGWGWDIRSPFAYQRGEKFPREGYGHTGWTGASVWVDPGSRSFVILLTNRNHPKEDGGIKPLRIEVGTLAAEAVGYTEPVPLSSGTAAIDPARAEAFAPVAAGGDGSGPVRNGIDVVQRNDFEPLAGMTVGLVTNHTGIDRRRRSTIDLLHSAPEVDLRALFSPEHGIRGDLETDSVDDGRDAATGLPIHSLFQSEKRRPTPAQMEGLDALVFDIQDIGCRFYTYISTMGLAMEAAGEAGKGFVVLDRVNPIGGEVVDGPIRSGEGNDFVAFHDIPVQHGMTVGELARLFRAERGVEVDLTVVPVENWRPEMRFDETGLPWVNPSPNIRSLTQAMLYPGVGLVEFTNLSVGRGTDTPFEHVGAPWIHEGRFARRLTDAELPGIVFLPTRFTPESSVFEGEDCGGVRFVVTDRDRMRPLDLGIELMRALHELYPGTFELAEKGNVLLRHQPTLDRVLAGDSREEIRAGWREGLDRFLKRREPFLLYPRD